MLEKEHGFDEKGPNFLSLTSKLANEGPGRQESAMSRPESSAGRDQE
jgi:hypothetical protein